MSGLRPFARRSLTRDPLAGSEQHSRERSCASHSDNSTKKYEPRGRPETIEVLYEDPTDQYELLGTIDWDHYQPGFRRPSITEVLPQLRLKAWRVGGDAIVVRGQEVAPPPKPVPPGNRGRYPVRDRGEAVIVPGERPYRFLGSWHCPRARDDEPASLSRSPEPHQGPQTRRSSALRRYPRTMTSVSPPKTTSRRGDRGPKLAPPVATP